jgi:alpha-tubulin suppressor-like RCC1 family protein
VTSSCDTTTHCCVAGEVPAGSPAPASQQIAGNCLSLICEGADAVTTTVADPTNLPPDGPCTTGVCNQGTSGQLVPGDTAKAGACSANGGKVCGDPSGPLAGTCVQCNTNTDCTTPSLPVCTAGKCVAATCKDGMQDGDETDVDCGGSCPPCADLKNCKVAKDCLDQICGACPLNATMCTDPGGFAVCVDTSFDVYNCGGCGSPCAAGELCTGGTCQPACSSGGGYQVCAGNCSFVAADTNNCGMCGKQCPLGSSCVGSACTGAPVPFKCQGATCRDGVKNGHETDTDCGGSDCGRCAIGKACIGNPDCIGGNCVNGVCTASCTDGIQDGNETGVDCGGPCGACPVGGGCQTIVDCATVANGSVSCSAGKCSLVCNTGWGNCDGLGDCNTNLQTTPANCGTCGNACGAYCVAGSCNDPIALATGSAHTCAILLDGTVWCWGQNNAGQLGNAPSAATGTPQKVAGLPLRATAIAGGGDGNAFPAAITCAVLTDGSLWCWGDNTYGQLGLGDTAGHTGPQQVKGLANVTAAAVGDHHACALVKSGSAYCWGANAYGACGTGNTNAVLAPSQPVCSPSGCGTALAASAITAGSSFTCALNASGGAACWGENIAGNLGVAVAPTSNPTPLVVTGLTGATQIASSSTAVSVCTLFGSGSSAGFTCWGSDNQGQLCNGMSTGQVAPPPGPATLAGAALLAVGGSSLSLAGASAYWACGANGVGTLGDGTTTSQDVPEKIVMPGTFTALTAGNLHTCGLTSQRRVYCWGFNDNGQVGNGLTMQSVVSTPTAVVWK